jgi:enamine deaminase RidA (YjgF/YER057c/UK114 family)
MQVAVERTASPFGGFSDTVSVSGPGRWIAVSGQVGCDDEGRIVAGDFRAEADACFGRIRSSLEREGATMADVVSITGWITDLELYGDYAAARGAAFPETKPASATVEVPKLLLGARLEVAALAFLPDA